MGLGTIGKKLRGEVAGWLLHGGGPGGRFESCWDRQRRQGCGIVVAGGSHEEHLHLLAGFFMELGQEVGWC